MIFIWTLLSLVLTLFAVYHVYIVSKRSQYSHFPSPPIPISPLWYFGHLFLFTKLSKIHGLSLNVILEVIRKETGGETIALVFGPKFRGMVYTVKTSINSKILSDHRTYLKREPENTLVDFIQGQRFLGRKNLLLDQGTEIWHNKRRIMDPAFQKKFLRQLMDKMTHSADQLCAQLTNMSEQGVINIFPVMNRTALEVICTCGFNLYDDFITKEDSKMNKSVNELFEVAALHAFNWMSFLLPWKYTEEKATLKRTATYLRDYMKDHLKDRFEAISRDQEKDKTNDILSYIVKGNVFSDELTIEDLLDDFFVFLIAGMETTAITMTCFIWEILKKPTITQNLKNEIKSVLNGKDELDFDDLSGLVYMEQCIKEALRLHAPVQGTFRLAPNYNTTVGGVILPPNTQIWSSIHEVHMSDDHWTNPEKFDPDRFGPGSKVKPFTFIPFTAGPRVCIGKHFAIMEMKVLLTKLLNDLQIADARPEEKHLEKETNLTVKPKNGVFITVA